MDKSEAEANHNKDKLNLEGSKSSFPKGEEITLQDLERKLAASNLGSDTDDPDADTTADPTKLLSINLLSTENQSEKNQQESSVSENNNSVSSDLPPAFQDADTEDPSVSEYFADAASTTESIGTEAGTGTGNSSASDIDIDLDSNFDPIPFDSTTRKFGGEDLAEVDSILNSKDYEYVFDETFLDDLLDITFDAEEGTVAALAFALASDVDVDVPASVQVQNDNETKDLIEAFGDFDIKEAETSITNSSITAATVTVPGPQEDEFLINQDSDSIIPFVGLGQQLYCLPCNDGKSKEDFDIKEAETSITNSSITAATVTVPGPQEDEFLINQDSDSRIPFVGLGQQLYCLPCNDGKEEVFDVDFIQASLDNLPTEKEAEIETQTNLDFDQVDEKFTEEGLDNLIDNIMQEEQNQHESYSNGDDHDQHSLAQDQHQQTIYEVSKRPQALERAEPLMNHFYGKYAEKQCFGHKNTIFGLSMSPCGKYCATASQDSTVCIFLVKKNKLLSTLRGSDDHECLRVAWASDKWGESSDDRKEDSEDLPKKLKLAMAGADGVATIWESNNDARSWKKIGSLDHIDRSEDEVQTNAGETLNSILEEEETAGKGEKFYEKKEVEGTEIYSLQFIDKWHGLPSSGSPESLQILMTSSEDFIHIWQYSKDPNSKNENEKRDESSIMRKVMDIKFTHMEHGYGGVFVHLNDGSEEDPEWAETQESSNIMVDRKAFGGDRNPNNLVYVFDAVQCPANNLLGVALSDGTTRLVNGRGVCVTILQLPGCQSHLTSLSWDSSGTRLASCVATGHVVLWDIDYNEVKGNIQPVCRAVLEGGHKVGRPLFGAAFFGGNKEVSCRQY